MGWIPGWVSLWIVNPFILAPNFVSVTPFVGILLPILRMNEVSTHWSSLFLKTELMNPLTVLKWRRLKAVRTGRKASWLEKRTHSWTI